MGPTSVFSLLMCTLTALLTAALLARRQSVPAGPGRHTSIDGLRGYLALFVFLHHGCVWYFYARTGRWELPPSRLYVHLGQSSVALFFMITGFLFFTKLLNARGRSIDWLALYIGRLCRLVPLYFLVIGLMLAVVLVLSGGHLRESPWSLFKTTVHWLLFTIFSARDMNQVVDTWMIVAGVVWSLVYEWAFYLLLPLLALPFRIAVPPAYLLFGAAGVAMVFMLPLDLDRMSFFGGGIVAAVLARWPALRSFAARPAASCLVLLCVGATLLWTDSAFNPLALALLSLAFVLIAAGASLFGLLHSAASRLLGETTYSIYLLHGLLLFVVFQFGFTLTRAAALSELQHALLLAALAPVLVLLSWFAFIGIEQPGLRIGPWLLSKLRAGRVRPALG